MRTIAIDTSCHKQPDKPHLSVDSDSELTDPVQIVMLRIVAGLDVFADQAADKAPALDPCGDVNGMARFVQRRSLLERLVPSVAVAAPRVLGRDPAKVPFAEDQHVIQALATQHAHQPLGR